MEMLIEKLFRLDYGPIEEWNENQPFGIFLKFNNNLGLRINVDNSRGDTIAYSIEPFKTLRDEFLNIVSIIKPFSILSKLEREIINNISIAFLDEKQDSVN